jgi:hypothetical protein
MKSRNEIIRDYATVGAILFLAIGALAFLIPAASAVTTFPITVDHITDTGILWNLTAMPQSPDYIDVYLDGVEISNDIRDIGGNEVEDTDTSSKQHIAQGGLHPNEWHTIAVNMTQGGIIYQAYNQTETTDDTSAGQGLASTASSYFWVLVVIAIAALMFLGIKLHWIFYWVASAVSFWSLYNFITTSNNSIRADIGHLQFWIYAALFVIPLLLWMMKIGKRGSAW